MSIKKLKNWLDIRKNFFVWDKFSKSRHVPKTFINFEERNLGMYISTDNIDLKLISVFDDISYDRADLDVLTSSMRSYAINELKNSGFRQISGTVLENKKVDIRCIIPKFHALGTSPFDALRYSQKREQDFFLVTPTQTACQIIDKCPPANVLERIHSLIHSQPVNLLRIWDFLENKPRHINFKSEIGTLIDLQNRVTKKPPLSRLKPLGRLW